MNRKITVTLACLSFALRIAAAQDKDFSKAQIKVSKVAGNVYMLEGAGDFRPRLEVSMGGMERRSFVATLLAGLSNLSLGNRAVADSTRAGVKVAADEDRFRKSRSIGFNSTMFKVGAGDTQGALFAMEQHSAKPGGPPLHLHHEQDEFWYVISGEYVFQVGSERFHAQAGDCLLGPRDLPHAYAFVGPSDGRILIAFTPAGKIQDYFERPRTPGAYVADAALYRAYGMELLGPPLALK